MTAYVGIDVSKEKLDVALLREDKVERCQIDNTSKGFNKLHHFLEKRCRTDVHVCLEATSTYGDGVAEFLHRKGYLVSVVNPLRIKAFADSRLSRAKTDQADALLIAHFCQTQHPPAWTPPPLEVKQLRALVRRLDDLLAMRQQEVNRQQAGILTEAVLDQLQQHVAFLDDQLQALEQSIDDHFGQHPTLKQQRDLITSIPGLGERTAARLLGEMPDLNTFSDAGQLAAFWGLTPKPRQSGKSKAPSRLSKQGSASVRAALYMPAVVAKRFNPFIRDLASRLQQRGLRPIQIVVAAMRKLVHLVFGILKSGQPFDPFYLDRKAAFS